MKKKTVPIKTKTIAYDQKRALSLISKFGVKLATIEKWQKCGQMPARYFEEKEIFLVNGKNIHQHRVDSGLSQKNFIELFNFRFDTELTNVSLSNWENGKGMPRKIYQNLLTRFYNK